MNYKKIMNTVGFVLAASIGFGSSVAAKETLNHAHAYPPGSMPDQAAKKYAADVEKFSKGALSVKVFPSTLLSGSEMSDGTRDGLADIGGVLTAYHPSLYPHSNMMNESSMQLQLLDQDLLGDGHGPLAFEAAMSEFVFFNCPECNREYADQNQVYTGNGASSRYSLLCTREVTEQQHLKGLRLRVAGAHWSRWIQAFGGAPVSLSVGDLTEALDQGVIDCTSSSIPDLINLGLIESTTDIITNIPGGVYAGASVASVNQDVWRSLSVEQRKALLRAGAHYSATVPWEYVTREEAVLETAREEGINIHQASPELFAATRDFVEEDLKTNVDHYTERYGVEHGSEMMEDFRELLEKWIILVQDVNSVEELGELYWEEIYSKVDVGSHGL